MSVETHHTNMLSVVLVASLSRLLKPLPWPAVGVLLTAAGLWDPNRSSSATHLYRTGGYGRQSCHRTVATAVKASPTDTGSVP